MLTLITEAHQKARKLIADHLDIVHEAAAYLLDKETITGEEFMAIVRKHQKES